MEYIKSFFGSSEKDKANQKIKDMFDSEVKYFSNIKDAFRELIDSGVDFTGYKKNLGKYLSKEFVVEDNTISSILRLPRDGDFIYNFKVKCYIVDKNGKSDEVESIEPKMALRVGGMEYHFDSVEEFEATFTEKNYISIISLQYHACELKFEFDMDKLRFDQDILCMASMIYGTAQNNIRQDLALKGHKTELPNRDLICIGGLGGFHPKI